MNRISKPSIACALVALATCTPAPRATGAASPACVTDGASAVLGTSGPAGFRALADGDAIDLEPGAQGAQHLWIVVHAAGVATSPAPTLTLRAVRASDGATIGLIHARVPIGAAGDGTLTTDAQALVIDDTAYCSVLPGDVRVELDLLDALGRCVHDAVTVHIADVDPAADPAARQARLDCCTQSQPRCTGARATDAGAATDATIAPAGDAETLPDEPGAWNAMSDAPMVPTTDGTVVWTGSRAIVWGGANDVLEGTGALYDPASDAWTAMSNVGAPLARSGHSAVWTGREMIVWGGIHMRHLSDGARYNPASDSWTAVSTVNAPAARAFHRATWTGGEMIVVGENVAGSVGARYRPDTDVWTALPVVNAPIGRELQSQVWTGARVLVWGGTSSGIVLGDGASFDPATSQWATMPSDGAPTSREGQATAWTGSEMVVWGGRNGGVVLGDGARFNAATGAWRAMSTVGAPSPRYYAASAWTGRELIVWGGLGASGVLGDGARYDPLSDTWTAMESGSAPSPREGGVAAWTGSAFVVWGGSGFGVALAPAGERWVGL